MKKVLKLEIFKGKELVNTMYEDLDANLCDSFYSKYIYKRNIRVKEHTNYDGTRTIEFKFDNDYKYKYLVKE